MPLAANSRARNGWMSEGALLKQRAYVEIKQRIQNATFGPGEFLSERQLAAQLEMSKTPVKAALERLEAEGFITVSPQQGIVVRDCSLQEIADQFEIRQALETHVLRALAGKLSHTEATQLEEHLELQRAAAMTQDTALSVDLDADFHMMFCEFHGNLEVIRVMTQLRDKIHRAIWRVFDQDPDRFASSCDEHAIIARAVITGDSEAAARAIKEHLNYGKQYLLAPRRR